jgi:hypothetical protein
MLHKALTSRRKRRRLQIESIYDALFLSRNYSEDMLIDPCKIPIKHISAHEQKYMNIIENNFRCENEKANR